MDVKVVKRQLFSPRMDTKTIGRTQHRSLQLPWKSRDLKRPEVLISVHSNPRRTSGYRRLIDVEVSCSYKNSPASVAHLESLGAPAGLDGSLVLKSKSQEIEPYLSGRCMYLVGMMGSGKTTVGKILSQVLSYSFVNCDSLVEQDVGGTSMADIFKLYGEGFFREKEEGFHYPSSRGFYWWRCCYEAYKLGISVWLEVPLDALAKRIAAVGTHSRLLLHGESCDVYTKALNRLSSLFKESGEAYANANAQVSLEEIAAKHGYRDISFITPAAIAIEALEQIERYLKDMEEMRFGTL